MLVEDVFRDVALNFRNAALDFEIGAAVKRALAHILTKSFGGKMNRRQRTSSFRLI